MPTEMQREARGIERLHSAGGRERRRGRVPGKPDGETYPEMPWSESAGMRNRLVHACFEADLDLVRKTEQEDLPAPIARVRAARSARAAKGRVAARAIAGGGRPDAAHRTKRAAREVPGDGRPGRADRRRRSRHRALGQVRGSGWHRPHRHLQLGPLPHGGARLPRGPHGLRQRERDRDGDGERGTAGGGPHPGARGGERHRPLLHLRQVP